MKKEDIKALVIAIGISQLAGVLGSLFTFSAVDTWYKTLVRPPFTPPEFVFGPVWTTLFVLMGIAAFLVWKKGARKKEGQIALRLFGLQLLLNVLWSFFFFGLKSPIAGSLEITVLWIAIAATIVSFAKVSHKAAWIMIPYLLWVSFATYLTYAFWILN